MQEKFTTIDGNKIRYLESGNSEKYIVLIHGLGASAERWEHVIPHLEKNYRLIVPDLIGFGHSDKPLVDYTPDFFSEFISKFFKKINISKTHLIGSSLGGQISVEFASKNNDVIDKLVLISPSGAMKHSTPALDAYVMAALYPTAIGAKNAFEKMAGEGKRIDPVVVERFVERMQLPNAKMSFMSTLLGLKNAEVITTKLTKITSPSLIIWGENDKDVPLRIAREMHTLIKQSELKIIEKARHNAFLDQPNLFFGYVTKYISNL